MAKTSTFQEMLQTDLGNIRDDEYCLYFKEVARQYLKNVDKYRGTKPGLPITNIYQDMLDVEYELIARHQTMSIANAFVFMLINYMTYGQDPPPVYKEKGITLIDINKKVIKSRITGLDDLDDIDNEVETLYSSQMVLDLYNAFMRFRPSLEMRRNCAKGAAKAKQTNPNEIKLAIEQYKEENPKASQRQMAKGLGLSKTTINKYENEPHYRRLDQLTPQEILDIKRALERDPAGQGEGKYTTINSKYGLYPGTATADMVAKWEFYIAGSTDKDGKYPPPIYITDSSGVDQLNPKFVKWWYAVQQYADQLEQQESNLSQ